MARLNVAARKPQTPPQATNPIYPSNVQRTHEGAPAAEIPVELQLRRAVCSCLLWEDTHYESGKDIGDRIVELVGKVPVGVATNLAMDARSHFHLRHAPLLVMAAVAAPGRGGSRVIGEALANVIQRPDELTEFLAIYAKVYGVPPNAVRKRLSAQVKKGIAAAFGKFDRYQLGKYFSPSGEKGQPIRARDAMFLTHPKPLDEEQAAHWKQLIAKKIVEEGGADTWETKLSSGKDKKELFEEQLRAGKLGYLALLRNLRNMTQAGVDETLIDDAIVGRRGARRVLPFRYVTAARACPQMAKPLDQALQQAILDLPVLPGRTVVLVDVSGSMDAPISGKSELNRIDVAATLGAIVPGDCQTFSFSHSVVAVGQPRGLSGIEAIKRSQQHGGTYLGQAVDFVNRIDHDRLIVITDEQSHDHVPAPKASKAYIINVASYRNGVGYGNGWCHVDGFSEQTLRFIAEFEKILN
jgi:hypothetical protein